MKSLRQTYEDMDYFEKKLVHKLLGIIFFTIAVLAVVGFLTLCNT